MEGLIPMVYRAIKRTRTRSRYECLSSGAAQTYNITDFYVSNYGTPEPHLYPAGDCNSVGGRTVGRFGYGHRRYNSVGDLSFSRNDHEFDRRIGPKQQQQKQLVRFRSHRMFSCITGAT